MAAKLVPPASKCWDGNFSALNNPSSRNVFTNDSRKFVVKTNYRSAKKAAAKKLRTNFGISARSDGGYIQSNYRLFIKLMTSSARCWSKKRPSPTLSTSSDHYWSELRKALLKMRFSRDIRWLIRVLTKKLESVVDESCRPRGDENKTASFSNLFTNSQSASDSHSNSSRSCSWINFWVNYTTFFSFINSPSVPRKIVIQLIAILRPQSLWIYSSNDLLPEVDNKNSRNLSSVSS